MRPTLAELVPSYVELGISKRDAVAYVIDSRMRNHIAYGHGNRARRRAQLIPTYGAPVRFPPRTCDVLAERFSEGRVFDRAPRVNPHD